MVLSEPTAIEQVDVAGCSVLLSKSVKILSVSLDQHLTFNDHVQNVCKSAQYHSRALQHIRSSLTVNVAKTVTSVLVFSRFNCANAVLYGASLHNVTKLYRAQDALSLVVTFTKHVYCIRPVLRELHFKVATINIQSSTDWLLCVLGITSCWARTDPEATLVKIAATAVTVYQNCRAFGQALPCVWDDLLIDILNSVIFDRFRSALRTYYYRHAFWQ